MTFLWNFLIPWNFKQKQYIYFFFHSLNKNYFCSVFPKFLKLIKKLCNTTKPNTDSLNRLVSKQTKSRKGWFTHSHILSARQTKTLFTQNLQRGNPRHKTPIYIIKRRKSNFVKSNWFLNRLLVGAGGRRPNGVNEPI